MADANLKVPSEERIRVSASESIINAVSPRVDISTITGGHRMTVTDIDGVETADIMDGVKGDTGDAAGFGTVNASVDANVGTPSVTVTSSGPNTAKNFDISFKNLKGVKGDTGDAAGFGTVSASVDANVGTPSVTVTSSGPNTAKNFDISFKNLKGDTGAAAGFDTPTASVDGYVGTPSVAVTSSGPNTAKKFNFAFHNLKGEKGDTGSIEDLIVDGTEPEEGAGVSVDGPISELSAEGWATQFSTTGKNLIKPTPFRMTYANDVYSNTVADTRTYVDLYIQIYNSEETIISNNEMTISSPGIYSKTITISEPSASAAVKHNGSTVDLVLVHWTTPCALQAGVYTLSLEVTSADPTVVGGLVIKNLQLELGSTATEYEPYTGGAPSPSPDYPQEIEVAKGRNLLDKSKSSLNSIVYSTDGHEAVYYTIAHTEYIKVEANTDYYVTNGIGLNSQHPGAIYDANKQYLRGLPITGRGSISAVINTGANAAYIVINYFMPSHSEYVGSPQLTLSSTPQPYVPYGYVGMEVQGKNLLDPEEFLGSFTANGIVYVNNGDGGLSFSGTATANTTIAIARTSVSQKLVTLVSQGGTFALSGDKGRYHSQTFNMSLAYYEPGATTSKFLTLGGTAVIPPGSTLNSLNLWVPSGVTVDTVTNMHLMLERGSTATEYEPYHHTTTPIPLPSRGWVGSLPDGTADKLSIDGAGKVEWEKHIVKHVYELSDFSGTIINQDGIYRQSAVITPHNGSFEEIAWPTANRVRNVFYSKVVASGGYDNFTKIHAYTDRGGGVVTGNTVTVFFADNPDVAATYAGTVGYYESDNPVTESLGYIDLPDIPAGSTVTIPELDALGISYYVDNGAIRKLVEQYKARLEATSFADIEDAVTELAAEVQKNTNRTQLYLGYDTVNGKQMISVFKRNV